MVARPITGWMYRARSGTPVWNGIAPNRVDDVIEPRPLAAALGAALSRWGTDRVATLVARPSWGSRAGAEPARLAYGKVGPRADAGVLMSGWSLIERGIADAVEVVHESPLVTCGLLLERTGRTPVVLGRSDGREAPALRDPTGLLASVIVATAAVELGIPVAPGGFEPDLVCAGESWIVEVRA